MHFRSVLIVYKERRTQASQSASSRLFLENVVCDVFVAQDTSIIQETEEGKGDSDDGVHISSDSTKSDAEDSEAPLFRLCYELPLSNLADEGKAPPPLVLLITYFLHVSSFSVSWMWVCCAVFGFCRNSCNA